MKKEQLHVKGAAKMFLLIILSLFTYKLLAQEATERIIAKRAILQKLGDGFAFTEGPTCDAKGNVFFTDQPNNRIWKWSLDGTVSVFLDEAGRANGMAFDRNGNLLVCSEENNEIRSIAPNGNVTVLNSGFHGKKFNGPNDIWIAPNGGLYLTDPYYKRSWWSDPTPGQSGNHVYYLPPGQSTLVRVTDDLLSPNGIIGTPDGKFLYVSDMMAGKTYRYVVGRDGRLSEKIVFAEIGSDGMTIDCKGNVYATGKGVTIFNKKGKQIAYIPINEKRASNVCFGGKKRRMLFITAFHSVYGLKMKVKGVGSE